MPRIRTFSVVAAEITRSCLRVQVSSPAFAAGWFPSAGRKRVSPAPAAQPPPCRASDAETAADTPPEQDHPRRTPGGCSFSAPAQSLCFTNLLQQALRAYRPPLAQA